MTEDSEELKTILAALRDTQPAPGMQDRVLQRLRDTSVEAAPRSLWTRMIPYAALAIVMLTVAVGLIRMRRGPATAIASTPGASTKSSATPMVATSAVIPSQAASPKSAHHRLTTQTVATTASRHIASTQDADLNIPEPPLPLTPQERLLQRFVRHEDAEHLAQLSPAARAARQQQDARQVAVFFAPPPPLQSQPYYEQVIISGGSQ